MGKNTHKDELNPTNGIMNKLLLNISVLSLFIFIPFTILNFAQGRTGLGIGTLALISLFALNIWAIKNNKNFTSHLVLFGLVPVIVIYLSFSIHIQKIIGVLWCYPAIISCYYFLPHGKARVGNLAIILFTFPVIWQTFDLHLVARIYLTLLLVSLLAAIFMKLVNEQQNNLQKSAATDFLTGVLNRTRLKDLLEEAIEQNRRTHIPMALVALDLDHFKKVNDEHGHVQGDQVLQDVAALLMERCRKVDKIFRLGGEEFLLLLYNTNLSDTKSIAEQLRISISQMDSIPTQGMTVSLGLALIKENENYLEWIKRADDKLYLAKENGRNRIEH